MNSDRAYIKARKRKARHLSLWFRKMQVFPIQNKIVFSTFEGDGGFCCNPRYIAEEILRRGWDCEMIWLTHDPARKFPNGIRAVKDTPKNIAYHLSTAAVWIDNYRKPLGTLKRKGQLYIQTWHASMGFKAVGLFRGKLFPEIARIVSEYDSSMIDYVISNSDYCTSIYPKKLLYKGSVLQVGSPRCDCLIKDKENLRRFLREKYELSSSTGIVLYAPTFRGGSQTGKKQVVCEKISLDIN
ncbi:MAG: CDP-glycerol glycerophosphotransferase family protein, partial [Selenomonadaceae bacterium]|nr:CDP-glycerol glycerophosphotransferase family protein [Selenomonadaceae bacterium]